VLLGLGLESRLPPRYLITSLSLIFFPFKLDPFNSSPTGDLSRPFPLVEHLAASPFSALSARVQVSPLLRYGQPITSTPSNHESAADFHSATNRASWSSFTRGPDEQTESLPLLSPTDLRNFS